MEIAVLSFSLHGKKHAGLDIITYAHKSLHVALTLISKQAHLLTTTHAVNIVQFKVNGTDPYDNGLFAYRPTAAPVGFDVSVCVVCVEPEKCPLA
jgi:hypothetical protein